MIDITPPKLSNQQINQKIAQWLGYSVYKIGDEFNLCDGIGERVATGIGNLAMADEENVAIAWTYAPKFCADLNAMRTAELHLTDDKYRRYWSIVSAVYLDKSKGQHCHNMLSATAKERAESLIRIIQ